ncbi:MAG TPA: vitamin K epoxide reductase family protein [Candidatus Limnocylindrales bacterium]
MADKSNSVAPKNSPAASLAQLAPARPSLWRRIRSIHPGLVLAALDLIGLGIASYLSYEELIPGGEVQCGVLHGCQDVAHSIYARPVAGIPVAVYGVILSLTLFSLAIAWWRTGNYRLLLLHYGLSLVGVVFEGWFQFAQIFLIHAVCVWCESYGISLVLRFVVALWVYLRTPNPNSIPITD